MRLDLGLLTGFIPNQSSCCVTVVTAGDTNAHVCRGERLVWKDALAGPLLGPRGLLRRHRNDIVSYVKVDGNIRLRTTRF